MEEPKINAPRDYDTEFLAQIQILRSHVQWLETEQIMENIENIQ